MVSDLKTTQDEMLFENAFKFASIGMALVSPEGKWLKVNEALCSLLGQTSEDLLKTDFQQITHPDDLDKDMGLVKEMLDNKRQTYSLEKRYFHKNGAIIWVMLSVSLIRHANGIPRFFISQLQNITELKQAQYALLSSSKIMALGEMSAGIAHEINNPLTIISLHASALEQLVKEPTFNADALKMFTTKINDTVKRISTIVAGLRRFSHTSLGQEEFSPTSVSSIIEDALGMCQNKLKSHGVMIKIDIKQDTLVECRPIEISQVLINLLNNAFYAVKGLEDKEITISLDVEHSHACLSVIDSGPAIAPEIKNKIMEPFFTTRPMGEGSGLGLSISRSIIDFHKGELYLDEKSSKTKFVVRLPHQASKIKIPAAS